MADYATLLRDHTTLTCRSVDRIFLEGYVPLLQTPGGAARYLLYQRGVPIPSSAAFGKIGEQHVAERASPDGVEPPDRLCQPLLLLPVGPGLGPGLLEDERVFTVPDLDLPQRPRVGQAAT